ncbi:Rv0361 family membrane protein [Micromonospora sp. NPDC004336]
MTQPPSGGPVGSPAGQPESPTPFGATPPPATPPYAAPPYATPSPAAPPYAAPGPPVPPPPAGHPPYPQPGAPRKKRGVLIASIALAVILLLCAGGGAVAFLTLRDAESGTGAGEPVAAVEQFLTAVYQDRDAGRAAALVCSSARDDKKVAAKVAEVEKYASTHRNPRFRWSSPKVDDQTGDRATVTTKVTMTTADEKIAEQDLRFTVVKKTGWRVCEVA